jgi:hypothetical protein
VRCPRHDDDDEDDGDDDTQIGPKETFKNPLLKLLYFAVRKFFRNLFSQCPAEKVSIFK